MSQSRTIAGQSRFLPGTILLGRYRLIGLLGAGGMGEVYQADDLKLGQQVALKFIPESVSQDPARLSRFLEEVRLARQISHPNVCRVHDIAEVEEQHFISMELVDGEDLASLGRRIGRLPVEKAVQISRQVCAGLAAAHRQGILHRDLKPANVMIDGRGRVRITDFGLAALVGQVEGRDVRSGTPAYMSPEQLAGREVTIRSDIYSLGLVLYELFTGRRAHQSSTPEELMKEQLSLPLSPSSLVSGIDRSTERAILRCLEPDPGRRPKSALEVAALLPGSDPLAEALAAGETPSPEMVAAAGSEGLLAPRRALLYMIFIFAILTTVFVTSDHGWILDYLDAQDSPQVLAAQGRRILSDLNHAVLPYTTYGFRVDYEQLDHIAENDETSTRWENLGSAWPGPVHFWFRQGPRPMVPENFKGHVSTSDPPLERDGMATVILDVTGRLLELRVAPPAHDPELLGKERSELSWGQVFAYAGLDLTRFQPDDPVWNPRIDCTSRRAWILKESTGEEDLRVEAGAYGNRLVYFRVVSAWTEPPAVLSQPLDAGQVVSLGFIFVALIFAVFLARRNLLRGRGDYRGAWKVALYILVVSMVYWVLRGDHVFHPVEIPLFASALGEALLTASMVWLVYLALEPYVRKIWPDAVISWNRLLAGRVFDPLLGRDILLGILGGAFLVFLSHSADLVSLWFGQAPPEPATGNPVSFAGVRGALAVLLMTQLAAVQSPLMVLLCLLLFRAILKRTDLAIGLAVLFFAVLNILGQAATTSQYVFYVLAWVVAILVITRFGVVSAVTAFFFANALFTFPPGTHLTAWYSTQVLVVWGVLFALLGFGFYISLGGRSLFDDDLLERDY